MENAKTISEYNKNYVKTHPESEYIRHRRYRQNNRFKVREKQRRYYLKKRFLLESFTLQEWVEKVNKTNGICPKCNKPYSESYPYVVTLDHTPPVSKAPIGYCYNIDDVQPMCGRCNLIKNNKF